MDKRNSTSLQEGISILFPIPFLLAVRRLILMKNCILLGSIPIFLMHFKYKTCDFFTQSTALLSFDNPRIIK